jgi:hypothetical protein
MWIYTKTGFISVVQHRDKPGQMLVRARNPAHLRAGFPSRADEVFEDDKADYRWRLEVSRNELASMLMDAVDEIDYSSHVKEVVSGDDGHLYRAMMRTWQAMSDYQEDCRNQPLKARVPAATPDERVAPAALGEALATQTCDIHTSVKLEVDFDDGELFCPACEGEDPDALDERPCLICDGLDHSAADCPNGDGIEDS